MRVREMNHVNLIGKMSSDPRIVTTQEGKKTVQFFLSTKETYLDEKGNTKASKNWHRVSAWGKWVPVMEKFCSKGQSLAIEGRLRSRFYNKNGVYQSYSEIEVNDLVIL